MKPKKLHVLMSGPVLMMTPDSARGHAMMPKPLCAPAEIAGSSPASMVRKQPLAAPEGLGRDTSKVETDKQLDLGADAEGSMADQDATIAAGDTDTDTDKA